MPPKSRPAAGSAEEAARLDSYLQSRMVISHPPVAVLVDAFQFVDKCPPRIARRWHENGASSGGAAATGEAITSVQAVYFLTHFHSDHHSNLSDRKSRSCGLVYASRPTAALVMSERNIPADRVVPLDFDTYYRFSLETGAFLDETDSPWLPALGDREAPTSLVSGDSEKSVFYVRLIPANHCPGAAMLLFTSAAFGVVLHTGDFRFNGSEANWRAAVQQGRYFVAAGPTPRAPPTALQVPFYESFMEDDETLRTVAGHVDTLFMDNTFCEPKYSHMSQWEATQKVVEKLRTMMTEPSPNDAAGDELRCVVLVGSYTLGKERVAFAVQEAFQANHDAQQQGTTIPIYVSPSKFNMLQNMKFHTDRFASLETVLDDTAVGDAAPTEGAGGGLREVRPPVCEVSLPILLPANGSGNAPSDISPSSPSNQAGQQQGRRIMLSIVMVPMDVVKPPGAASEENPTPKGTQDGSLHAAAQRGQKSGLSLLKIADGLGIDLARFDRVLAVEPTGWVTRLNAQDVSDGVVALKVPYSEHCSFREMISFVKYINPRRIVPTVSVDTFRQHETSFTEVAPRLTPQ